MIPERFTLTPFTAIPYNATTPPPECPDCESSEFTVRERRETFHYGKGDSAVDVSCLVPTYVCSVCGCEWTGPEAEDVRHDAICHYIRRLTPHEILRIRDESHLSQAEFSRITGFGEASLSRWETGNQIQNVACDRLLRLIKADYRNLELLRHMADGIALPARRFQIIELTPELRQRQTAFILRRAG
jgi:putative zinc finger/helix-turn-helix YgiT family protein